MCPLPTGSPLPHPHRRAWCTSISGGFLSLSWPSQHLAMQGKPSRIPCIVSSPSRTKREFLDDDSIASCGSAQSWTREVWGISNPQPHMQGLRPSCSNSAPAVLPHGEDLPPPTPGLWGSPSEPIKKGLVLREVVLRWNPWTAQGIKRFLVWAALKRGCGENGVHRREGTGGGNCHWLTSSWSLPSLSRGQPQALLCHSLPDAWGDTHHFQKTCGFV